jgi:hypothetical protein
LTRKGEGSVLEVTFQDCEVEVVDCEGLAVIRILSGAGMIFNIPLAHEAEEDLLAALELHRITAAA